MHISRVERFIREASKGLGPMGACKKSGRPGEFRSFAEKEGKVLVADAKLMNFRESRSGAVLTNGGGWYALLPQVVAYLKEQLTVDGSLNRLLPSILASGNTDELGKLKGVISTTCRGPAYIVMSRDVQSV